MPRLHVCSVKVRASGDHWVVRSACVHLNVTCSWHRALHVNFAHAAIYSCLVADCVTSYWSSVKTYQPAHSLSQCQMSIGLCCLPKFWSFASTFLLRFASVHSILRTVSQAVQIRGCTIPGCAMAKAAAAAAGVAARWYWQKHFHQPLVVTSYRHTVSTLYNSDCVELSVTVAVVSIW